MEVEIVKFDNMGRGIGYLNNKIVFVPKTVPGDIVKLKDVKEKKNYIEGNIDYIKTPSKKRCEYKCPYYDRCGGCDLGHISYSDSLEYKLNKVNDIFKMNKINYSVDKIVKSSNKYNYRNKVSLKVIDKKIGYYETKTHELVEIGKCLLCKESINSLLKDLSLLNIINGEIVIRSNYKNELLIIINSQDKIDNIDRITMNHKVVGVVINEETIYGNNYFIDKIDDYLFKVSYNAFFQINEDICSKIFKRIAEEDKGSMLDFYCGVGTFSVLNNQLTLGVEINENAINDANSNKLLNKKDNIEFICADAKDIIDKINNSYKTILLDPPRSGVNKDILNKIISEKIEKIIYISCFPISLARDIKILENDYSVKDITLFDMFPMTEHVETLCVLERK